MQADTPRIGRQTDRQTDRPTDRPTDRKTERQKDRETGRQKDRQTDRQTDKQTDTETVRHLSYQCLFLRMKRLEYFRLGTSAFPCLILLALPSLIESKVE